MRAGAGALAADPNAPPEITGDAAGFSADGTCSTGTACNDGAANDPEAAAGCAPVPITPVLGTACAAAVLAG